MINDGHDLSLDHIRRSQRQPGSLHPDGSVKPCPFCGREVVRTETGESNVHFVFCRYCHAHGPQGDTDQSAIEYWNMRSPNDQAHLPGPL